jgi:hypothetical protein
MWTTFQPAPNIHVDHLVHMVHMPKSQRCQPAIQPAITTVRKRHTFRESAVYFSQAVAESLESGSPASVLISRAGRLTARILDVLITHTCGMNINIPRAVPSYCRYRYGETLRYSTGSLARDSSLTLFSTE